MFETILVAVDGSQGSDRAFDLARSMTTRDVSRLVILHVTELVGGKGGTFPLAADDDDFKAKIQAQAADLRAQGVKAEVVLESIRLGGPAHVIADVGESVAADLIVVGTRGRSPLSEVILGSVPIRLLQVAHRPVLVVPAAAGETTRTHS
ncbi:MAG: universal stress protein [Pseudonocardiales bacterium]